MNLGKSVNTIERETGLPEVRGYLKNSMAGREMIVRFVSLGPTRSPFTICGVQITDSAYVAHSDDMLYRPGYEQFKLLEGSPDFFRVLHSAGRTENGVSVDIDKRRIYIDIEEDLVYSVNTQYAGNTVGFKKLCLRLAIRKADRESWLAEHMFVMGVKGPNGRKTYFSGAFPSMCGKTSTAMIPGETIIGDDLAYLREIDGCARVVNVESGVFGIIQGVNAKDDPVIWEVLMSPGEVIFSNILVADGAPYWSGAERDKDNPSYPKSGVNFSGEWHEGKIDETS
jgi:phosphoenolpyruvate carboxykinase (GTP)